MGKEKRPGDTTLDAGSVNYEAAESRLTDDEDDGNRNVLRVGNPDGSSSS